MVYVHTSNTELHGSNNINRIRRWEETQIKLRHPDKRPPFACTGTEFDQIHGPDDPTTVIHFVTF